MIYNPNDVVADVITIENPMVTKLNVKLITHRITKKGKTIKLTEPYFEVLCYINTNSNKLLAGFTYTDEYNQTWVCTSVGNITLVSNKMKHSFNLPSNLIVIGSTFSIELGPSKKYKL